MSSRHPHLCLVLRLPPGPGTGSGIIVRRHLERLHAGGWRITVATDEGTAWTPPAGWTAVALPRRRRWWPPCREGTAWSGRIRSHLLARELRTALRSDPPDVVLTVLWGEVFTEAAALAARHWRARLALIAHDRPELMAADPRGAAQWRAMVPRVLRPAAIVWPATDVLLNAYPFPSSTRVRVLSPIPEAPRAAPAVWREEFARRTVVIHAGRLHDHQLANFEALAAALAATGGELWLVTDGGNPVWQTLSGQHANVRRFDPFPTNDGVKTFLREHASAVLVSYHMDPAAQPWAESSFPSKLIDYAPLGIPALILAPPHASVSVWARRHDYPLRTESLAPAGLESLCADLRRRDAWQRAAGLLVEASRTEFSPDRIHAQFVSDLAASPAPPRLSAGRLWLLLVHRPWSILCETIRRGPWDAPLCAAGQRAMRASAASLPPTPTPICRLPTPVVFLTGRRFWDQTVFCAHTLRAHLGADAPFVVMDDDTLGEREADHLRRVVPNVVIHWRHEIEARLDAVLPADRFPTLRRHRLVYPHLRKLTDVHAALGPGWKLVLDSDMLFFRRPLYLAEWLCQPVEPCFATDVVDAYGYPRPLLESLAGIPLPERLNVGVIGLRSEDVDWPELEMWTRELLARHGAQYYLEQALSAMLVARLGGVRLPREDYLVMPDHAEGRSPRAAMHHYVAGSKSAYFRTAWRIALARACGPAR